MENRDSADTPNVVHFEFDPADLRARPGEKVDAIATALAEGRRVELSPLSEGSSVAHQGLSEQAMGRVIDATAFVAGGAVLTLAALAIAPASVVAALVAGAVGGTGTAVGSWLHRKHAGTPAEPHTSV